MLNRCFIVALMIIISGSAGQWCMMRSDVSITASFTPSDVTTHAANRNMDMDITANNTTLHSGGFTFITVNFTRLGSPLSHIPVNFSASLGTVSPNETITDENGSAIVRYDAPLTDYTIVDTITVLFNDSHGVTDSSTLAMKVLSAVDPGAPCVGSVLPAENSIDVDRSTNITIEFTKPMNESSVSLALTLSPAFTCALSWSGNNLTIIPMAPLFPLTEYEIGVETAATDLFGNSLEESFLVRFTTKAARKNMTMEVSVEPWKLLEGETGNLSVRIKNENGIPLENVDIALSVIGPGLASTVSGITGENGYYNATVTAWEVSGDDEILINVSGSHADYIRVYHVMAIPVQNRRRLHLEIYSSSVTYTSEALPDLHDEPVWCIFSGESLKVSLLVTEGELPVKDVNVSMNCSTGELEHRKGVSGDAGEFLTSFKPSETISEQIVTVSIILRKWGFFDLSHNFTVMVRPLEEYVIVEDWQLDNGTEARITMVARGTVKIVLGAIENPTLFTEGFLGRFINVSFKGQGRPIRLNVSITFDDLPRDFDEKRTAMHFLEMKNRHWLRCSRTGIRNASNEIWCNMTWNENWTGLILAPKTKKGEPTGVTIVRGRVVDDENRALSSVGIELHRSGVKAMTSLSDANGTFLFENIGTGGYEIVIDESGYWLYSSGNVTVIAGENNVGTITLQERREDIVIDEEDGYAFGIYAVFLIVFLILLIPILLKIRRIREGGTEENDAPQKTGFRSFTARTQDVGIPSYDDEDSGYECPVCGSDVPRDATTCPVCSAEFLEDKFVCPDCGMPLTPQDLFCRMCGTVFGREGTGEWKAPSARSNPSGVHEPIEDFEIIPDQEAPTARLRGQ